MTRSAYELRRVLSWIAVWIVLDCANYAFAQRLSIGASLAGRVTGGAATYNSFGPVDYDAIAFGPVLEIVLPGHLSLEAEALYGRVQQTQIINGAFGSSFLSGENTTTSNWLRTPALVKWHLKEGPRRPFI